MDPNSPTNITRLYKPIPTLTKLSFISHFLPLLDVAFFAGDLTLFGFTLFAGAFLGAAAFFGAGLGAAALLPGDVLVEVLEALAGFSLGLGLGLDAAFDLVAAVAFGFTVATGFVLVVVVLALEAAAFGLAAVLAFVLEAAFDFAGALEAAFVSFGLEAGLALGFVAAGFFLAGADAAGTAGLEDLADGSL